MTTDREVANLLGGRAAVAGIGATEFSKNSGRSEMRLAVEAVAAALADAAIAPEDVDGMVTFTADTNPEIEIARNLGIPGLRFFSRIHHGGGAGGGCIQQAAMAVATGVAEVVVCYRAFNERSGNRFGAGVQGRAPVANAEASHFSWYAPFGLLTPAQWVAMFGRRIMHAYGVTSEDFGRIAVADRKHAATNPAAFFYGKPITLEDHQQSRWIVEPLHLLDCCQESDGAQAIVVTSLERARDLRQRPVPVVAAAHGGTREWGRGFSWFGMPDDETFASSGHKAVADRLYRKAGVTPQDIDVALIYDHFTPMVLMQLEEYGFCKKGEGGPFVLSGAIRYSAERIPGTIPVNTHGGQLSEAYVIGATHIMEGVEQLRGTAINQVEGAELALVTGGPAALPTSGLILGRDR